MYKRERERHEGVNLPKRQPDRAQNGAHMVGNQQTEERDVDETVSNQQTEERDVDETVSNQQTEERDVDETVGNFCVYRESDTVFISCSYLMMRNGPDMRSEHILYSLIFLFVIAGMFIL